MNHCKRNFHAPVYRGNERVQRMVSCGFNAGFAHFERKPCCENKALRSGAVHEYPIVCRPPERIDIERVVSIPGIDDSLFLVGDVANYKMNKNFQVEISGDAINVVSGNFATYLLLKNGSMHTLGFSTANIEKCLRRNSHMFTKDGIRNHDLELLYPDLAPQDENVELEEKECAPRRYARETIISNSTLADNSTTIRIDIYECDQLVDTEIWFLIKMVCENVNTVRGMNVAAWDDSPRTCGEVVFLLGRSTNNGLFVLAGYPTKSCGCHNRGYNYGYRG